MKGGADQKEALRRAAVKCGLSQDVVIGHLKLMNWSPGDEVYSPETLGECDRHPDSGLTQWGTCWGCYAENFGSKSQAEQQRQAKKYRAPCQLHPGARVTDSGECWECYALRAGPSGCKPA